MRAYTYLMIDFFTILVPFIFSFHPKLRFDKKWRYFFPSMAIVALIFLIWDSYFTHIGVWGFNPDYLIGVSIFNLPIEEILFFVCIPYACVFTYHCFGVLGIQPLPPITNQWITISLVLCLGGLFLFYYDRYYTSSTFFLLIASLIYLQWVLKADLSPFYFTYLILLIPFSITNGLLTGSFIDNEVVWYNDQENLGLRLGTIPFEDVFYGMLLILWNVKLTHYLSSKY
ncbi:lycopene cyclase domain-containing protein [Reichenbachiella carrageenanivorans]|uniref:Lycopene cyclase domain-containing protein n=1 Tax=Reichenbachiella carrageenanivorans TaxID=2979869 RepID=A0ABY6CXZ5_9BACT|nr:lycopene cyclase domain-containing protein [Reichenbachiella carrageenanivorans]UXX78244.1 lycopene cyclase domain-containing protein [Reichenbachiella carrageenanivorans]